MFPLMLFVILWSSLFMHYNVAVQCSGSINRRLSSANEGIQGELVNVRPRNSGPHQAMLVLGQEGFSPHPLSVWRPGPWHRGPLSERRSALHFWCWNQTRPVSLIVWAIWIPENSENIKITLIFSGNWNCTDTILCPGPTLLQFVH